MPPHLSRVVVHHAPIGMVLRTVVDHPLCDDRLAGGGNEDGNGRDEVVEDH